MKNFKEEIENSGMSFTEGGSYEAKNKEEIYLNLANCSEEELKEVEKILKKETVFYYTNLSEIENRPILHYGNSRNIYGWLKGTINFLLMYNNKTEVNFQEFKEIMGVKVETSSENTQVEKARLEGVLLGLKICKEMFAQGEISHENIYENEVLYREELENLNHQPIK